MSKTLKKLTILVVLTIAVVGSILGGLSATANAQSDDEDALRAEEPPHANWGKPLIHRTASCLIPCGCNLTRQPIFPLPNPSG